MTSDAKIGLLLGLVFIFVIAFIINGLPNFGNQSQAEATPIIAFQDDNLGVAGNAQNAQKQLDWDAMLEQESEALVDLEPVAIEPEAGVEMPETIVATDTQYVRGVYTLDSLMDGVSALGDVVNRFSQSSRSTPLQVEASEPAPAIEIPEPKPASSGGQTPKPRRSSPAESRGRRPGPKIYVVEDGDVLATVAKKAYGADEGNRLVNINRIFEANRTTLKSPDEIFVGQKLIIPTLPKAAAAGKVEPALSGALFEKVQDIGRRNLVEIGQNAKPQGLFYVVQDGDNLWKIASTQLGNGARSEEIAKLNTDLLKSKDTLAIGTRLRLPAK